MFFICSQDAMGRLAPENQTSSSDVDVFDGSQLIMNSRTYIWLLPWNLLFSNWVLVCNILIHEFQISDWKFHFIPMDMFSYCSEGLRFRGLEISNQKNPPLRRCEFYSEVLVNARWFKPMTTRKCEENLALIGILD